jgi:hypothetical protein
MRFHPARNLAFACVLGLASVLTAPARSRAQSGVCPDGPNGSLGHSRSHHGWCFHGRHDGIPRTYSYYYDPWFNQPCHFRVVGPDGKTYWRSTVRGLPMGTPWIGR